MDVKLVNTLIFLLFGYFIKTVYSSLGDRSPVFHKCIKRCFKSNCTDDGSSYKQNKIQPLDLKLLQWKCIDDCKYVCMWGTVETFVESGWRVPQFYGKWPFIRLLGIQEPASVIFSLCNLIANVVMLKKFRKTVRKGSPLYWFWHTFALASIHTWFWSVVFHCRDTEFTEFMDYACAFSYVLFSTYCAGIRLLYWQSKKLKFLLTALTSTILFNHVTYLSIGSFDYSYNMRANITVGATNAILWLLWSFRNRKTHGHVWKCVMFTVLACFVSVLEVFDFPPILWILDGHALWHLATVPLIVLFYSFVIDDVTFLRNETQMKISLKKL